MFVTKSKRMLAAVLVVGVALGGFGAGVGLPPNSVAGAEMQGDQALDGLWEDIENKGGWLRFDGSTIKYRPAGESDETVIKWTCRYNLTLTPMTIDIFNKEGTILGIFVFERNTLFIALGKRGHERPTIFRRDPATTLFVLKRAVKSEGQTTPRKTADEPVAVHGILESVDAKKGTITVKGISGDNYSSVVQLVVFESVSDKQPAKDRAAEALKLANVPVRSDATIRHGEKKLELKDLQAGSVVSLQLAPDRKTGFVVGGVRVVKEKKEKKQEVKP
jgi:hypothetical protein